MGGKKKRDSSSSSEEDYESSNDEIEEEIPSKLKEEIDNKPIDVNANSDKPMERRKKRKALDKERRKKPKISKDLGSEAVPGVVSVQSSSGSELPEFHIGVFKELASADASVRKAAAEKLVVELVEVQKAYEKGDKVEVVEGVLQLEAEKDDGLTNCAPSLRYAIQRLIRGVSSSREETTFIEQLVEDESQMEGVPYDCLKVMNWHLHLYARNFYYPRGWLLQKNLDVTVPLP